MRHMGETTDTEIQHELGTSERSLVRSHMYFLLAAGFSFPSRQFHSCLADGTYSEDICAALAALFPELYVIYKDEIAFSLSTESSFEDFEGSFLSAFEINMPQPSVSLYEGSYVQRNNRPGLLLEIKRFYRHFGLEMAALVNDLDDTLAAELEFMQFLTAKQAQADEQGTDSAPYRLAQRDFLKRHLTAWLPAFSAAAASNIRNGFFVALAKLVNDFVTRDFTESLS